MFKDSETNSTGYGVYNTTSQKFVIESHPDTESGGKYQPYSYKEKPNNPPNHALSDNGLEAASRIKEIEKVNSISLKYWKKHSFGPPPGTATNLSNNSCYQSNKKVFNKQLDLMKNANYIIVLVRKQTSVTYSMV